MKTPIQSIISVASVFLSLLFTLQLSAQEGYVEKKGTFFDLIETESFRTLELDFSFDQLDSLKKRGEYLPATLKVFEGKKDYSTWNIRIKARGKYRRRICDFPPIKMKFKKDDLEEQGLKRHNDFKLVTHCVDDRSGKENVLREYLAYQLYPIYSDKFFRTQLVKIKYDDTESGKKFTRIGMIIEDEETMEKRLNGKVCDDCFSVPKEKFDLSNIHINALFQYMIGNSDWSIAMNRNLKLLEMDDSKKFCAVPYDFDFSGLVNASYALPNTDYGLKTVRERVFLGQCDDVKEILPYIDHFLDKKQEAFNMVQNFKLINGASRRDILEYLESFYASLEDKSFLQLID